MATQPPTSTGIKPQRLPAPALFVGPSSRTKESRHPSKQGTRDAPATAHPSTTQAQHGQASGHKKSNSLSRIATLNGSIVSDIDSTHTTSIADFASIRATPPKAHLQRRIDADQPSHTSQASTTWHKQGPPPPQHQHQHQHRAQAQAQSHSQAYAPSQSAQSHTQPRPSLHSRSLLADQERSFHDLKRTLGEVEHYGTSTASSFFGKPFLDPIGDSSAATAPATTIPGHDDTDAKRSGSDASGGSGNSSEPGRVEAISQMAHVFGSSHAAALEQLRRSQLDLAKAWRNDSEFNTTAAHGRGQSKTRADKRTADPSVSMSDADHKSSMDEDTASASADQPSHSRPSQSSTVTNDDTREANRTTTAAGTHPGTETETSLTDDDDHDDNDEATDHEPAGKAEQETDDRATSTARRVANEARFAECKAKVDVVVSNLRLVTAAMKRVEVESRDMWSSGSSSGLGDYQSGTRS